MNVSATDLYEMIAQRFRAPEWAVLPGVASATGTGVTRRCDALAMNLWPSRGLELHGFEIKVSRGDFLRELKAPEKAETIARYCDRWWLVVSDADIVLDGELPPTWGLLVRRGSSLRLKRDAGQLTPIPISRHFLAALLRVAATTMPGPAKLEAETKAAREAGFEEGQKSSDWHRRHVDEELKTAKTKLEQLTTTLGISDHRDLSWRSDEKIARAVRFAMRFALDHFDAFDRIEKSATQILEACRAASDVVEAAADEAERTEA